MTLFGPTGVELAWWDLFKGGFTDPQAERQARLRKELADLNRLDGHDAEVTPLRALAQWLGGRLIEAGERLCTWSTLTPTPGT